MKKFKYNLQKVLDVREMVLKKTQRDLAMAEHQRMEAEQELQVMKERVDRYYRDMQSTGRERISQLKLQHEYFFQLLNDVNSAEAEFAEKEAEAREVRERLTGQLRDHKMLNRLKDRKYAAYLDNLQKKEQLFLDEVALQRRNINGNSCQVRKWTNR